LTIADLRLPIDRVGDFDVDYHHQARILILSNRKSAIGNRKSQIGNRQSEIANRKSAMTNVK